MINKKGSLLLQQPIIFVIVILVLTIISVIKMGIFNTGLLILGLTLGYIFSHLRILHFGLFYILIYTTVEAYNVWIGGRIWIFPEPSIAFSIVWVSFTISTLSFKLLKIFKILP